MSANNAKMPKKLVNMFKLSSKVTVYVPSTIDINVSIDTAEWVDATATLLSNCFGGATSAETLGYWTSPAMGLVKERTTMVFAYCTDTDLQAHIEAVVDFCEAMKKALKQEAIAMEINGDMYFI